MPKKTTEELRLLAEQDAANIDRTYVLKYTCFNCRKNFKVTFQFGEEAAQKADCPNCGCRKGERHEWR